MNTQEDLVVDAEESTTAQSSLLVPATPGSVYGGSRNIMKNI